MKDPLDSLEAREMAYQEYSDAYKDIHGRRPTFMANVFREGTVEEYSKELELIWKEYKKHMEEENE